MIRRFRTCNLAVACADKMKERESTMTDANQGRNTENTAFNDIIRQRLRQAVAKLKIEWKETENDATDPKP